jgi:serine/threonine-protein kinase
MKILMDPVSSLGPARGGREEVRAALLRPALLHLQKARGRAAVTHVLSEAGLYQDEVGHDSAWISLSCTRQILESIMNDLGEEAVSSRGQFTTDPSVLGIHMRLLRRAVWPKDAYIYAINASSEQLRVGSFTLDDASESSATITYTPFQEIESEQRRRCFCLLRQAELKSYPVLWGLPEATLEEETCTFRGDLTCRYHLKWEKSAPLLAPWTALAAAGGVGSAVSLTGNMLAAGVASALGALLGGAAGHLASRLRKHATARSHERFRIQALEHGLEQRGQLQATAGDLTHSVLGGKYRILRAVGSGGIGTVYAAEHLGLGFQVAVKVLRGAAAADAAEVARLRREARVQMSLEHPNVVRTFDLDQMPDGTLYVVMELLQGLSLQEQLKRSSPMPPGFAIPIFMQSCRALSAAHRLGIVHRDLKPGNIFLCEGGAVKVLDFGMSKLAQEESLTQDGYTLGTPEYMSPEQCIGGTIDARSDIYAFGVLMYEALTGELPFRAKNRQALLEHHQRSKPRLMRQVRSDLNIPEELDRIVLSCLAKNPNDRPQDAQYLELQLASLPPNSVVHEYPRNTPRTLRGVRTTG